PKRRKPDLPNYWNLCRLLVCLSGNSTAKHLSGPSVQRNPADLCGQPYFLFRHSHGSESDPAAGAYFGKSGNGKNTVVWLYLPESSGDGGQKERAQPGEEHGNIEKLSAKRDFNIHFSRRYF